MRDILTELEADKEIGNLEEDEAAMIEEIAKVFKRREKDKLPALRDIAKKKLVEETAKADKVLCVSLKHLALQKRMNVFTQKLCHK